MYNESFAIRCVGLADIRESSIRVRLSALAELNVSSNGLTLGVDTFGTSNAS